MTRRGPRSVPVLLFAFLTLLDLTVLLPWTSPAVRPLAGLTLLAAVGAAVRHVVATSPRRPAGPPAPRRTGPGDPPRPVVVPLQRRREPARPRR
jgi:hypothetical protein